MKTTIKVKAVFIGEDGSCGFKHGRKYILDLILNEVYSVNRVELAIVKVNESDVLEGRIVVPLPYSSFITFLQNWSEVSEIQ